MIRVWSEHLGFEEAASARVLDYLESHGFHPVFAVHPGDDLDELGRLVRQVQERGLEAAVWPLLDQSEGYWPSVGNAERFGSRVREIVDHLEEADARPSWLAFDMEPPISGGSTLVETMRGLARERLFGEEVGDFRRAVEQYADLAADVASRGIETLGVTTLPVAIDVNRDVSRVARWLETPWMEVDWDRAGFMAYGSIVQGLSGGMLDYRDVRALHYRVFVQTSRRWGDRAHASLGITGTGVYGDEPVYERPRELALDVAAARAAGIRDLAIFSLEGFLGKKHPDLWAKAVVEAGAEPPPPTVAAELMWAAGGVANRTLDRIA